MTTAGSSRKRISINSGHPTGYRRTTDGIEREADTPRHLMDRVRDPGGTGKFVPRRPENGNTPSHVPEWVELKSGETLEAWKDRIYLEWCKYQISQGFQHDLVSLKRHELAAKQLWPVKQELDITARRDQDWTRHLTDEELLVLKSMKDEALARNSASTLPVHCTSNDVQADSAAW